MLCCTMFVPQVQLWWQIKFLYKNHINLACILQYKTVTSSMTPTQHHHIYRFSATYCQQQQQLMDYINYKYWLTFIISSKVLNTMSIMMKYSNGVDTTIRQTLYLKLFLLLGMYRSSGLAPIVKSIQDF